MSNTCFFFFQQLLWLFCLVLTIVNSLSELHTIHYRISSHNNKPPILNFICPFLYPHLQALTIIIQHAVPLIADDAQHWGLYSQLGKLLLKEETSVTNIKTLNNWIDLICLFIFLGPYYKLIYYFKYFSTIIPSTL